MLDLLKLNVGADVTLGRVHLGISGVEAQAQLKVRLDNVVAIIDRVLTTLDRNPELLPEPARGVGAAVRNVGGGARHAVGELGAGTGRAVQDVGRAAGSAVRDVGRGVGSAAEDVGESAAPTTVQDVGRGARRAVEEVGGEAGPAVVKAGQKVGYATGSVTEKPAEVAGTTGGAAEGESGGDTVRKGAKAAAGTASEAPGTKRPARSEGRGVARRPAAGDRAGPPGVRAAHAPAACGTRTGSCHHGPAAAVRRRSPKSRPERRVRTDEARYSRPLPGQRGTAVDESQRPDQPSRQGGPRPRIPRHHGDLPSREPARREAAVGAVRPR